MAQSTEIRYSSDLSGSSIKNEDNPTVSFSLDGTNYEIDLTTAEQKRFRDALAEYVGNARRARTNGRSNGKVKAAASGPAAADVRAWGRENGWEVTDRGRVSKELREAYDAAH